MKLYAIVNKELGYTRALKKATSIKVAKNGLPNPRPKQGERWTITNTLFEAQARGPA
jgi:hypothetical protein